ncbi:DNA polymerase alpha-associated DNA helicase A [Astathelohania contejeani]|uniref:DNA polymerase alpha-associated DNA helicase A n=1 Tax=Astathelohania contejeani TaxID=164912 RepID=A0ABQ7HYR4_9MICR|nr:DNA polymerase alpha-associated DNA helicase A [Thelohania contejeani]
MEDKKLDYLNHIKSSLQKEINILERSHDTSLLRCNLISCDNHIIIFNCVGKVKCDEEYTIFYDNKKVASMKIIKTGHSEIYGRVSKKFTEEKFFIQKSNPNYNLIKMAKIAEKINPKQVHNEIINSWLGQNKFEDESIEESINDYFDPLLNTSQKNAVSGILKKKSYKIIGPPGTGKTRTIVEIIMQLLKRNNRVLVAGPSNIAVDNILDRFKTSEYCVKNNVEFFRLGSSHKSENKSFNLIDIAREIKRLEIKNGAKKEKGNNKKIFKSNNKSKKYIKNSKNKKRDEKQKVKKETNNDNNNIDKKFNNKNDTFNITEFVDKKIKNSTLIFSTLFSSFKIKSKFDWVIIDEACQSLELESLIAVIKAPRYILVGDPFQLGPVAEFEELKFTLFERLNLKTYILKEQYRMCNQLMEYSNSYFYKNEIKTPFDQIQRFLFFENSPILFIDTFDSFFRESESNNSKLNITEVELVEKVYKYIQSQNNKLDIGIITPYSSQAIAIRERIDDENVKISTVDGFQGQEKDVIIVSLVRSNDHREIGFLDEARRMNVAITRCKLGLAIIGDSRTFKTEFYKKYFEFLNKNSLYIDPNMLDELLK